MTVGEVVRKLDAQDRRKAAIHEAGHLTVACALGYKARAWIIPTGATDPLREYLWNGQCESACKAPEYAIAGVVAETWAENGDIDPSELCDFIDLYEGRLSPTDRALIPEGLEFEAIQRALRLLQENHRFFKWAVRTLLDAELVTDGQAGDAWTELTNGECDAGPPRRNERGRVYDC